jgi:integrase/recombinase XerC/integrase/recombinase XerD
MPRDNWRYRQHRLQRRDGTCANAAAAAQPGSWLSGNYGHAAEQAARGALPGHALARDIDDFLTELANANRPRNTIRAYRGDRNGFAAHHDGEIAGLTAAPVRAFPGKMAGQAPATRKRERAAVVAFCKWAVRHKLLEASPMDRIDAIEVPGTLPGRRRTSSLARHRYRCTGRQSGEA